MLREYGLIWDSKKKKKEEGVVYFDKKRNRHRPEQKLQSRRNCFLSLTESPSLSLPFSLTHTRAHTLSHTHGVTRAHSHAHSHTHRQSLSAALCSSQEMNGGQPRELLYLQMTYPDHMMR